MIAKAIWDEKAKIATSGDSQQEYRANWEEVQQIIREADAIAINSSQETLQASEPAQTFSYNDTNGGTEPPSDNAFTQLPIPDS